MRHWRRYGLAGVVATVLGLLLLWPIGQVVGEAFGGGDDALFWLRIFADESRRAWLLNAVRVAGCTTVVTLAVALPLAVLADRVNFRGKALASAMLMAPMILPPFVGALAFNKLFSRGLGPVNLLLKRWGVGEVNFLGGGFWAVVILEALHLYPIVYLNATAALANVDPSMEEAARNLGASRWRVFRRITLPLIRPGLFAGATIAFIWSFCELGTPLMVGYEQVLPVKIFDGLESLDYSPQTPALVFALLGSSVGLYAAGRLLFGRAAATSGTKAMMAGSHAHAGWLASALCWLAFGVVTLAAVVPHVGVVLMSVAERWTDTILPAGYTTRHLQAVFRDVQTWNVIINSLRYAGASTALCAVLGLLTAYLVVRCRIRGAGALDSLSMLPLAVPGLVMAAGYFAITRPGSFLAPIGPRQNPTALLIVAYSIRRLPYMVRSIAAGLQQTPEALEEAAENLGASRLRALTKVTLPLILGNIVAGSLLTFAFNMLEVSDSLVLAQTAEFYPITKLIYETRNIVGGQQLACALGVYGMVLLGGTLLAANMLLGKRMGQLFRV